MVISTLNETKRVTSPSTVTMVMLTFSLSQLIESLGSLIGNSINYHRFAYKNKNCLKIHHFHTEENRK